MYILRSPQYLTGFQRGIIAFFALVFVLTGSRVQAAEAEPIAPVPLNYETGQTDVSSDRADGLTVPTSLNGSLTPSDDVAASWTSFTTVTAYNSVPGQTDASPFTTADGTHVRDGIIAANFLKFGTRVRIPELFGNKVFEVHDRMNARFDNRIDIWMDSVPNARQLGVRHYIKIEVL